MKSAEHHNPQAILHHAEDGSVFEFRASTTVLPIPIIKDIIRLNLENASQTDPKNIAVMGRTIGHLLLIPSQHFPQIQERITADHIVRRKFFDLIGTILEGGGELVIRSSIPTTSEPATPITLCSLDTLEAAQVAIAQTKAHNREITIFRDERIYNDHIRYIAPNESMQDAITEEIIYADHVVIKDLVSSQ